MKKDNFNEWYKNNFEQLREEPPADVWDNIQSELDLEEVWTRVDHRLTLSDRYAALRKWSYGIAAALLITAGGMWMRNSLSSEAPMAQKASRHELSLVTLPATAAIVEASSSGSADPVSAPVEPGRQEAALSVKEKRKSPRGSYAFSTGRGDGALTSSMAMGTPHGVNDVPGMENKREHIDPVPGLPALFLTENSKEQALASVLDLSLSPDSLIAAKIPKGFSIGAAISYNNTWIMNSTTYAGLKSKGLYSSRVSLAGAYGLSASYDINSFWGMEATITDLTQRQVYSYYNRSGEYKEKANTLEYFQLAFLVKKRKPVITGNHFKGLTRTLAIGPALRKLYSATDETNGSLKGASYQYAKNDYGLLLAYGYDIPVRKKLLLQPGVTAYVGIKDISRGRGTEPSHFNRTHNLSIGAQLTARYILGK